MTAGDVLAGGTALARVGVRRWARPFLNAVEYHDEPKRLVIVAALDTEIADGADAEAPGLVVLVVRTLAVAAQPLVEALAVDVAELQLLGDVWRDGPGGGSAAPALRLEFHP